MFQGITQAIRYIGWRNRILRAIGYRPLTLADCIRGLS